MEALFNLLFPPIDEGLVEKETMEKIEKMEPDEQVKAVNELLRNRMDKLSLNRKAAVALSKLAARSDKDLKDARAKFAKELSNSTLAFDPEGYQKVQQLMVIDLEHQMMMVEARKAVLEAKDLMDSVLHITTMHLFLMKISYDHDQWSETYDSLTDEFYLLKDADDLLKHLSNGLRTRNDLLTSVIHLTSDLEQEIGFTLPGMCSPETKALYHHALAHHLKGNQKEDDDDFVDCKMWAFVGDQKKRHWLIAFLDAKQKKLIKATLQRETLPLLKQLKEKLGAEECGEEAGNSPEFADQSNAAFDNSPLVDVIIGLIVLLAIAFCIFFFVLEIKKDSGLFSNLHF